MNKIYLIDFGISQKYQDENLNHLPFKENVNFKGNVIFSSKNAFAHYSLSRRDDIISFVYLIIFCINSNVSWVDNNKPVALQFNEIGAYKLFTKPEDFCDKRTSFLVEILTYAYSLEYDERPDYNRLKFMMKKIMLDREYIPNNRFDWSMN